MLEKTKKTILAIAEMDAKTTQEELESLREFLDGKTAKAGESTEGTGFKLMTVADACEYLRVKRGTIWRWTTEGKLNPIHLSDSAKSIRYKSSDLDRLVMGASR